MNLAFVLEERFRRTPDGQMWSPTTFGYSFWRRYLDVFDSVRIVARVLDVPTPLPSWKKADGEGVGFVAIPYYVGPWQLLLRLRKVIKAVQRAVTPSEAVILRVPSMLANLLVPVLRKRRQPFCLEVVGDPWDVFSPEAAKYPWPLRIIARRWSTNELRKQCATAAAASYVTQFALQRRYPLRGQPAWNISSIDLKKSDFALSNSLDWGISDVELRPSDFYLATESTPRRSPQRCKTIITVGSLDQMYKGVDVLIDAVSFLIREGGDVCLMVMGDGRHRPELEKRVVERRIAARVKFIGQLPAGEAVRAQLDQADLFVLASKAEGLPRAMIEAMARGLPCIGTTVGGIPELLPLEDVVSPNNAKILAEKIREVVGDLERMAQMSSRNLQKAREYRDEILRQRRIEFYRCVRETTEIWQRTQQ